MPFSRRLRARALAMIALSLALAAPARPPAAAGDAPSGAGLHLLRSDRAGVVLEYRPPAPTRESRVVAGRTFDLLRVAGAGLTGEPPGAPQMPVRGVLLGMPPGARASLTVTALETEPLPGSFDLLPVPALHPRPAGPFASPMPDGEAPAPDPDRYAAPDLFPASPAALGESGQIRSQRVAQISLFPLQYRPAERTLARVTRLRVEVRFTPAPGEALAGERVDEGDFEPALAAQLLNYASARNWRQAPTRLPPGTRSGTREDAPRAAAGSHRIKVGGSGIYRLTGAALKAAGLPAETDPRTLKVFKDGAEVPTHLSYHSPGGLADDDYLEFYGQGLSNRFADTNVYWLAYGGAQGQRATAREVTPQGPPAPASFPATARIEESHYYITDYHTPPQGDPWYWGVLYNLEIPRPFFYVTLTTQFTLPEPDATPGISATLQLALHGATCFDCPDTLSKVHHPRVTLNGTLIFDQVLAGDIYHAPVVSFPHELLQPGANTLAVTNLPLDPGVTADASFFDWFEIGYRRAPVADAGRLAFQPDVPEPAPLELTGFTSPDVALYDVTDPLAPVRLTGGAVAGEGPYRLHFQDSLAGRAYFAFGGDAALTPTIEPDVSTSSLRDAANGADQIIIAYDDFLPALGPLVGLRQSEGLRVTLVRTSDVYDEFSDGVFDPTAIQRFLEYAYTNWQPPAPAYVLLVGDGNFNYRNYQGNNLGDDNQSAASEVNFVPPYMVNASDPLLGEVASDNRYVMLTPIGLPEKDRLPDMAVGRLPARDLAEATAMVAKLVAYQSALPEGDWRKRVAFYADNYYRADGTTDGAGDFPGIAQAQIAAHLPPDYLADRVYYDPSQPGQPPYYNTVAEVQAQIRDGLNAGSLIANYLGHGARGQWANENLLDVPGVAALANGNRLPVVIEQTCYTGQFAWPGADTLAETWLRGVPAGGAVAAWAATGASVATGHDTLAGGFLDAVFNGGVARLGLAADAGKLALYASGASLDLLDSFVLFGDPALVLASAAPAPTFADVPLDHWAYPYIESLYAAGITGGCGQNPLVYCPESSVSRAQMAVFLLRGLHGATFAPPPAAGAMFSDVPANYWAAAWIEQLAREGVTGGCGGENFCPESSVTRAQMAVFLLRAGHGSDYTPPPATGAMFSDVPAGHWAAAWIEQLAREGITGGCGPGLYCPETSVTRAQMAVFLVRTFQLPLP